ncbi:tetratricopeptide repeat domain-containing protein [Klebsormidium nitens]|uniref:Tetratricopeptide repeat domain-containing protein n=1 Tax=Klebsormidium nitens TaxID=105231 RepID=A0A1Y1IBV6_KLENI|nr:tetratricopeptide repeat domain-containing protein [Klebsormidium nitens]|eukprot:GAQ87452.1 tetratricopeptide repeat domain-containing protein [Klebsormidium nitens]
MAILEEIDDDAEQKKTTSQARRKPGLTGSSKMGAGAQATPKGLGLARGFLRAKPQSSIVRNDEKSEAEKRKSSNAEPEDKANLASEDESKSKSAKPEFENPSKGTPESTADQRIDDEGRRAESAKSSSSQGLAKGFLNAPVKAASQAGRSQVLDSEAIDQPPLAEKHGRSAEGFARGFLNPKQRAPVQSTAGIRSVSTANAEVSGYDTAHAGNHVADSAEEGRGKQVEGAETVAEMNADGAGRDAILSESGLSAVKTGGAPQQADVEDTWSVETQISDRSELHEEAASALRGAALHEAQESLEQAQDRTGGAASQSADQESESVGGSGESFREMHFAAGVVREAGHSMDGDGDERRSGEKKGGSGQAEGESEGGNKEATGKVQTKGGIDGEIFFGKRGEGGSVEEKTEEGAPEGEERVQKEGEMEGGKVTKEGENKGNSREADVNERTEKAERKEEAKALENDRLEGMMEEHREKADRLERTMDDRESKVDETKSTNQEVNERAAEKIENGDGTKDTSVVQQSQSSGKQGEETAAEEEKGENEEEEDEFHDACEDEEQQRKQALVQAEQARARGNELYATANYERALEVYSKALELAPPAYVNVETPPQDEELSPANEEIPHQKEAETPHNEEPAPETSGDGTKETEPLAQRKADAGRGLESNAEEGGFGEAKEERGPGGPETGAGEGGGKEAPATEQKADVEAINCRAACHANRAACFVQLALHDAAVRECSEALKLKPDYLKVIIRRAQAYDKLDKQEEALADWKTVLEKDPANRQASAEIRRLEPIVNGKREKMREEMLGKLKELGNSVLGHFGLSVDNFKAVQDPNTGGYSINFSK